LINNIDGSEKEKLTLPPGDSVKADVLFNCANAALTEAAKELAEDPKKNRTAAMATIATPIIVMIIENLMARTRL
jgi:hypothetical protein